MHQGFGATNGMNGFMLNSLGTLGESNSIAYCINAWDDITGEGDLPAGVALMMMQTIMSGSAPGLTLYGPMNGHYRIDQTPSLGPTPTWSMMTNLSIMTNPYQATLTPGSGPMQFYRAVPMP